MKDKVLNYLKGKVELKQNQNHIAVKLGKHCLAEIYEGQIAISDKYIPQEIRKCGKYTKQNFKNNLYFKFKDMEEETFEAIIGALNILIEEYK